MEGYGDVLEGAGKMMKNMDADEIDMEGAGKMMEGYGEMLESMGGGGGK